MINELGLERRTCLRMRQSHLPVAHAHALQAARKHSLQRFKEMINLQSTALWYWHDGNWNEYLWSAAFKRFFLRSRTAFLNVIFMFSLNDSFLCVLFCQLFCNFVQNSIPLSRYFFFVYFASISLIEKLQNRNTIERKRIHYHYNTNHGCVYTHLQTPDVHHVRIH